MTCVQQGIPAAGHLAAGPLAAGPPAAGHLLPPGHPAMVEVRSVPLCWPTLSKYQIHGKLSVELPAAYRGANSKSAVSAFAAKRPAHALSRSAAATQLCLSCATQIPAPCESEILLQVVVVDPAVGVLATMVETTAGGLGQGMYTAAALSINKCSNFETNSRGMTYKAFGQAFTQRGCFCRCPPWGCSGGK